MGPTLEVGAGPPTTYAHSTHSSVSEARHRARHRDGQAPTASTTLGRETEGHLPEVPRHARRAVLRPVTPPPPCVLGDPIKAHFGPLRQFTLANSNHPNHTIQPAELHRYLSWRNANARHPEVLAAQRHERARIRREKGIRWGGRPLPLSSGLTSDPGGRPRSQPQVGADEPYRGYRVRRSGDRSAHDDV